MGILAVSDVVWQAFFAAVVAMFLGWMQHRNSKKLDTVAEKVEVVRHATNSLTDQLVAKTEAEALARGGAEERERADNREER